MKVPTSILYPSGQPDPGLLEPLSTSEASPIWGFSACWATPQTCSFTLSKVGREPSFLGVTMVNGLLGSSEFGSSQQSAGALRRPWTLHASPCLPAFQAGNVPTNPLADRTLRELVCVTA